MWYKIVDIVAEWRNVGFCAKESIVWRIGIAFAGHTLSIGSLQVFEGALVYGNVTECDAVRVDSLPERS